MDFISDFADQLLEESTSLANYELKERMRETDAIRQRSETSSGAEEQGQSDAVSIVEGFRLIFFLVLMSCLGTIVSFASVEEQELSFRAEAEEQASEEATFHDAMLNDSVQVIPAEISEYYSAMEEALDHVGDSTTDQGPAEEVPDHVEHSATAEHSEQSTTEENEAAERLVASEPEADIDGNFSWSY